MAFLIERRMRALEAKLGIGSNPVLWMLTPDSEPMTGEQICKMMRAIDGRTRAIPSQQSPWPAPQRRAAGLSAGLRPDH